MIAALGIATTLTVLVLERSRQFNTLFAVGASFRQIRSIIFWEAAFMVVIGELAGVICGFILSYLLVYVINRQSFGWTFLYGVDWGSLGLSIPLSCNHGAGCGPAGRKNSFPPSAGNTAA